MGDQSAQRLDALAAKYVARGSGVLVMVGDRVQILPQLEGPGLPAPQVLTLEAALEGPLPR